MQEAIFKIFILLRKKKSFNFSNNVLNINMGIRVMADAEGRMEGVQWFLYCKILRF